MYKIDIYFDFLSPYSYLAYRIAREHFPLSSLNPIPVSLPHIIAKSGNIPPASLEARPRYLKRDLERSAEFHGLPDGFKVPERFPFDTRAQLYALIDLIENGRATIEEVDGFIMKTFERIFHGTGFHEKSPEANPQYRAILMRNTEEALNFGAYGVPFWRVTKDSPPETETETFFGSDRFHHIAAFLRIDPAPFYHRSKL